MVFIAIFLENLHLVLNSLGFRVPKQLPSPREAEVLFKVRDLKSA
jgi:hypothetical protein